jgi:hypothetical protein
MSKVHWEFTCLFVALKIDWILILIIAHVKDSVNCIILGGVRVTCFSVTFNGFAGILLLKNGGFLEAFFNISYMIIFYMRFIWFLQNIIISIAHKSQLKYPWYGRFFLLSSLRVIFSNLQPEFNHIICTNYLTRISIKNPQTSNQSQNQNFPTKKLVNNFDENSKCLPTVCVSTRTLHLEILIIFTC